jgi:hypothetical protein
MVLRGGVGLFNDRPDGNSVFGQVQNPPSLRNVTVRNGLLTQLGTAQFSVEGVPSLTVFEYNADIPSSTQWNAETQMTLPWATSVSIGYVGQHSYNTLNQVNINGIDLGSTFLAQNQDSTLGTSNTTPGANAVSTDLMRAFRGYGNINMQISRGWRTFHSLQLAFNRRFRDGFSFGFNDTITLYDHQSTNARMQHNPDGTVTERADQSLSDELLGTTINQVHTLKGNFVWDLPDLRKTDSFWRYVGLVANDWQLSGIWTGGTGTAYNVGFTYQNGANSVNLTGTPDIGARIIVLPDLSSAGCSGNLYKQFDTSKFQGPAVNSTGLESGGGYLRGCFQSTLDLSLARNIQISGGRTIQLRFDAFNAPNSAIITGRNSTIAYTSPADPLTPQNLPYDASGNLIASRSIPRGAGFGVASGYQAARTIQFQVRFSF